MHGRTDGFTDKPKQYAPHFFKVGGIKIGGGGVGVLGGQVGGHGGCE